MHSYSWTSVLWLIHNHYYYIGPGQHCNYSHFYACAVISVMSSWSVWDCAQNKRLYINDIRWLIYCRLDLNKSSKGYETFGSTHRNTAFTQTRWPFVDPGLSRGIQRIQSSALKTNSDTGDRRFRFVSPASLPNPFRSPLG